MSKQSPTFDWMIDASAFWPPKHRPSPPFGPSAMEVLRSCPLRSCFEVSSGYERRVGFAARIGTAFHRVLQSLNENPRPFESLDKIADEARRRFSQELKAQEAEADKRTREQGLPRDGERANRAAEAIVVEALRIARENPVASGGSAPAQIEIPRMPEPEEAEQPPEVYKTIGVEVEVPVSSRDGVFRGRVDRAEHSTEGTHIHDYKSALRDDLPERYERQLQLYAFMWHDTRNEWPVDAHVVYPLAGEVRRVEVQPEICQQVAAESAALISQLRNQALAIELGAPGDVCSVCDFRPWCQAFWRWQSRQPSGMAALQGATLGFEGRIASIAVVNHYWRILVSWRSGAVQIVAPQERFPQLARAQTGWHVRALDMRLHGLRHEPHATVTDLSEIFMVVNPSSIPAEHA